MKEFLEKTKSWVKKDLVPHAIAAVLLATVGGGIGYWTGYSKGRESGLIEGAYRATVRLEDAYKAKDAERVAEFERKEKELRAQLNKEIAEAKAKFDSALASAEESHERQIESKTEERVKQRYSRLMKLAEVRYDEGRKAGYQAGLDAGRKVAVHDRRVQDFLREYLDKIDALGKEAGTAKPNSDQVIIASNAVIETARRGRETFDKLSKLFNGKIDQLARSIQEGNMDLAISLARTIAQTRKSIELQFQSSLDNLSKRKG